MDPTDETEEKEPYIEILSDDIMVDTTCTICFAEFLDPDDLKIHLDQVHKITSTVIKQCQFCAAVYSDMMEYAEHIRDNHLMSLKLCSKCWRAFEDFDAHRNHCKKHKIDKSQSTYSCSQCPQRFADQVALKKHEFKTHANSTDGVFLHEVFPYLSAALKVKFITFIDGLGTDVVYTCVGCSMSSVDLDKYLKHVRTRECKIFICHKCSIVFKRKTHLIKHFDAHCNIFGTRERRTQLCTDCNVTYPFKMYTKHQSKCKPIKCYTCNIRFDTMNEWSEHQSKEHSKRSIEVETCRFCWKRTVGKLAMEKHIEKTHKPELHLYKYLCVYCNSVFKHPQKLFAHFITKHKDISPYTCKICNEVFKLRKRFTIHIKLKHKSAGFVELDENYNVFFTETKSENPFVPTSIYQVEIEETSKSTLNTDLIELTDTDGNQTDRYLVERKPKLKRKRTSKIEQDQDSFALDGSDNDDEPLNIVRKRVRLDKKGSSILTNLKKRNVRMSNKKKSLTCKLCDKYCYTYQNYLHHTSLHSKHEIKKCIKCAMVFKSSSKLNEHIASKHTTSKLTETLKIMLEKRKTGRSITDDLPTSVRFRRTVVKIQAEVPQTSATINPVNNKLSVQKFLENFVPDDNKMDTNINSVASIKLVKGYAKEPSIKMTPFKTNPISTSLKLAMPLKFVDNYSEKFTATIKMVESTIQVNETDTNDYYSDHYDDNIDSDRQETIPEVAEEVMLENTEETPKHNDVAHKIVIPKLPTELTNIRIAHLLPEAPFYKIVKVQDVLAQTANEVILDVKPPASIKLPDGTKLVTTNPLAHLLGANQDKVLNSVRNKYYQPKNRNVQGLLTKALIMLDKPTALKRKKKEIKIEEE